MFSSDDIKKKLGYAAAGYVVNGMTIGAGTGTTAYWFLQALAERIREGLQVVAVPTSAQTARVLQEQGVPMKDLNEVDSIDLVIDGADEIDPGFHLIKGGGAAHLQEKMVAAAARSMLVLADESKLVNQLGRFPLPVEVIPCGSRQVGKKIKEKYGIEAALRIKDGKPVVTDHGHHILDCSFGRIEHLHAVHAWINQVPGVVENGLFLGYATATLIGYKNGSLLYTEK
ncbi:MAG: ribose-5-phosphate isomerase RpiA [Flavihumibacter sp.]